jgi:serine phosphatase RsbU (regulator of sigma subunit)/Tfp pilus assembly protein PilF
MIRIAFLLIVIPLFAFSQENKADSLLREYNKSKSDTVRARLLINIGQELAVKHPDSAIYYLKTAKAELKGSGDKRLLLSLIADRSIASVEITYKSNPHRAFEIIDSIIQPIENLTKSKNIHLARESKYVLGQSYIVYGNINRLQGQYLEALENYLKALEIAEEFEEPGRLLQDSYNNLGVIYRYLGELDKAMEFNLKAKQAFEQAGDNVLLAGSLNNIGNVYHVQGNYSMALEYYQQALALFEKNNDLVRTGSGYYNIGVLQYYMKNHSSAMEYFNKSLEIREKINDKKGIINLLVVMGMTSNEARDYESSEDYFLKALSNATDYNDQSGIGHSLSGLSLVYKNTNEFRKALDYSKRALELFEKTGNVNGVLSTKNQIAEIYFLVGNYDLSIYYAKSSFEQSEKIGFLSSQLDATKWLINSYEAINGYKPALEYAKSALTLKDSIFNTDMAKATSEMEARFQTEKKQLEIENLTKEQALRDAEIEWQKEEVARQRILTSVFLIGFIFVAIMSYLLYRQYRAKKSANILLELQNSEINQKNEEIRTQRDEISTQRDYVIRQKDFIEASHQRITDSINYAKLIQSALLPSEEVISEAISQALVFYKPRDIVSGDFYWVKKIKDNTVVIAADCTGHGVPGAFMSMLGIAFLNEITRSDDILKASDILDLLRQEIKNSLYQKAREEKANDGMDMSVLFINDKTKKAQFAGARNSLYIIRKNGKNESATDTERVLVKDYDDDILIEYKGDAQSVSFAPSEKQFINNEIELLDGDTLYLFSDGFIDQLNSKTNRRFNTERFKKLLVEIHQKPLNEQHTLLEEAYNNWRNDNEQIDDILIIGLKV